MSIPLELPDLSLYSGDSPFNVPIPADAKVHPDSRVMVRTIVDDAEKRGFFIAKERWTIPVYFADENTRRRSVKLTARWAPKSRILGVPIPRGTKPDPAADGHVSIIDLATGCEYDFWEFTKTARGYEAGWGNATLTTGSGVFPKGLSARGSGFALPAGMIWPDELERGLIDHALVFSYVLTSRRGAVPPATESDGSSRKTGAIPEGARVRLNPRLDLDSLGLKPWERTVAEALQTYGMYLGDDGGGVQLQAVHPMSAKEDSYEGLLPDRTYVYLNHIPVNKLQVLDMPEPTPARKLQIRIVPTGCATFR